MNEIVIVTGSPGSGKSTTARTVAATFGKAVHLHTDDFWHYIVSGAIPPYLPEADNQNQTVLRAIANVAHEYAAGGFTVFVDGIVGPWMLHHFRTVTAGADHLRLHYIVLRPSKTVAVERAQARTAPNALVDQSPIEQMWDQFSSLGDLERHMIENAHHTPTETHDAVVRAITSGDYVLNL